MSGSVPAEVDAGHGVELFVVRSIEVAQSAEHVGVDVWVNAALGVAETARPRPGARAHTREALGRVEVEMLAGDERPQTEERLYVGELGGGVGDEAVAVHEVDVAARELTQPGRRMPRVQSHTDRRPRRVDRRPRGVQERSTLEGPRVNVAAVAWGGLCLGVQERSTLEGPRVSAAAAAACGGLCLGEVRERACDRVADDDEQTHITRHVVDALRGARRHEVARRLLDCQLTDTTQRHPRPAAHTHRGVHTACNGNANTPTQHSNSLPVAQFSTRPECGNSRRFAQCRSHR